MVYADTGRTPGCSTSRTATANIWCSVMAAMLRAGTDLLDDNPLLVPVPLTLAVTAARLQPVGIAGGAAAKARGLDVAVDALLRVRATPRSRGMSRSVVPPMSAVSSRWYAPKWCAVATS